MSRTFQIFVRQNLLDVTIIFHLGLKQSIHLADKKMQVFLPFSSFEKSVCCLDSKRLGNQIYRECLTLVRGGWPHHPVSKIWKNHKHHLCLYALLGLDELRRRGRFYPRHYETFTNLIQEFPDTGLPKLVGYEPFHSAYRSALLAKNYDYYSKFGWKETPKINYIWS